MAVQAQYYPSGSLQDIQPKNGQEAGSGGFLLPPFSYPVFTIAGCELVAEEDPQPRAVPPLAVAGGRKRSRHTLPFLSREDGSFEDERLASSATAGAPNHHHHHNQVVASLFQDLSNHTLQQHHEFHNFILNQTKRFCHRLEEKRQQHSLALLAIAEETFRRELRLREEEMEKLFQGSQDLEDRAKYLRVEIHAWQSKARSSEAMVIALQNALQKAKAHNEEQSKLVEGSGDSELDDAESVAHVGARPHTKTNLGMQCCKRCRLAEATILVLPCRHLCCCKNCESSIESCPLCHLPKTASVEVYLS